MRQKESEWHLSTKFREFSSSGIPNCSYLMTSKQRWRDVKDDCYQYMHIAFHVRAKETKIDSQNILTICHLTCTFVIPINIVAVSCSNRGLMSFFISKQARHILSNFNGLLWAAILSCTTKMFLSLLYDYEFHFTNSLQITPLQKFRSCL